ncbi:MAG: hypothetical protein GW859_03650 [Sphingomonadales bacterium]|nr:hypothetical protein [Sphingomonadales bacterium]
MTTLKPDQAMLWTAVLAIATVAGSPAAACVLPFAATAAVAAVTLDTRRAMLAVMLVWIGNQAIGFGLMDYPVTQDSIGWGFALLGGTVAAMLVARFAYARTASGADSWANAPALIIAFAMAFATYETSLFVLAQFVGGLETFTPYIVGLIALNDTLWFVLLMGLRAVLVSVAPARFGTVATSG